MSKKEENKPAEVAEVKPLNLMQKLAKIQLELKAPKNQRNNFGRYNYRSAEDILEAAKPLCIKYGVVINISDDVVFVPCRTVHYSNVVHYNGEDRKGEDREGEVRDETDGRIYVKARVTIIDTDDPSATYSCTAFAREEESKKGMDGSQVTGAASSYARKYALNGMFAIDDTKDSDATNQHGKDNEESKPTQAPASVAKALAPAKKPAPNPKKVEAWKLYQSVPANAGVDKKALGANFAKMCVEVTGNSNPATLKDDEWNKVIDFVNAELHKEEEEPLPFQ